MLVLRSTSIVHTPWSGRPRYPTAIGHAHSRPALSPGVTSRMPPNHCRLVALFRLSLSYFRRIISSCKFVVIILPHLGPLAHPLVSFFIFHILVAPTACRHTPIFFQLALITSLASTIPILSVSSFRLCTICFSRCRPAVVLSL